MTTKSVFPILALPAIAFVCLAANFRRADEPLTARIDALIEVKLDGNPVASTADDAEFLRRVFLDLTGRIPAVSETREFLNDSAADKREKLIDRLLAGGEFPR